MPSMTNIGGLFVSLGLQPDKNSFETGNKLIDGVTISLNKLIGTARNAAVVLATTAVASASVESKTYKTAQAIGITTESFNLLKAAAKIAGVNTEGFLNSVGKLGGVLNRLKFDASGVKAYQEQLGKLGVHFSEIKDMAADDAFGYIMKKAESLSDQYSTAELAARVEDVLGSDAMNFFIELQRQGISYDQFMAGAGRTQFVDSQTTRKLAEFQTELNTLKTTTESLTTKIGGDMAEILKPYVETLNTFLQEHGDEIATNIAKTVRYVEELVKKFVGSETVQDIAKSFLTSTKETVSAFKDMGAAALEGDIEGVAKAYGDAVESAMEPMTVISEKMTESENATVNALGNGRLDEVVMNGLQEGLGTVWEGTKKLGKKIGSTVKGWFKKDKNQMDDGILRPDGTITQVAPDDWVFAARNVGDLAKAFIPQGMMAGAQVSEYSIVQNFTINGGSDLPQILRQQAYNGVQEGLLAVMNQSTQRLQMMSGTR